MQATDTVAPIVDPAPVFGAEQWLEFLGHLHPMVLHTPIGLLAAVLLMELVSLFSPGAVPARRTIAAAFALSAATAAATGWLLARDDYSGSLVDDHRMFGTIAAVLAGAVAALDLFGRSGLAAAGRRLFVLAAAALIGVAGHHGGMITHGRSFLSSVAPPWLAPYLTVERAERASERTPP